MIASGTGQNPSVTESSRPAELLLGPMLRHVDDTSATIWVETTTACAVDVLGHTTTTFEIHGHHYALVVVEGLAPGSTTEYEVRLDATTVWPPAGSDLPPSVIRTTGPDLEPVIVFGSCRAAAPHEPPYTYELLLDHEGRGVDALWAYAREIADLDPARWPHLLILAGDQVYADDSSPQARERIERRRESTLPADIVADYEEYTWLYREAWAPDVERWFFSVVPSAMIFDDHDMIDDWNISGSWVDDIRAEPWWREHVVGGIGSYLVHQHLGNLSPHRLRTEGLLAELCSAEDPTGVLRTWAERSEQATPLPGGYAFHHVRDVGPVRVVTLDCRNGRVLTEDARAMIDDEAFDWLEAACREADRHLVIVTSLPVFVPAGLHDLQVWNERVCAGAWGRRAARLGERIRRALDLEDWAAFTASYERLVGLLTDLASGDDAPTITLLTGDIHFAFDATVTLPNGAHHIRQIVSSPLRNALIPPERGVIRFMLTRRAAALGRVLTRLVGRRSSAPDLRVTAGPVFSNNLGVLAFADDEPTCTLYAAKLDDDERPRLVAAPSV